MKDIPLPEIVDSKTLATLLGLTANRVNALARDGAIPRTGRNAFPLADAVQAYLTWAAHNPPGRKRHVSDQRDRLTAAQADLAELKLAQANGDLLPAAEVAREWQGVVIDLRARLLAMPARVAAALGLERAQAAALDAEVRAALEDIADDR